MKELDTRHDDQLNALKAAIQTSDLLAGYLDEEEDQQYNALVVEFEPRMHDMHQEVARNHPLQLIALEEKMLDEQFEGLYIPRLIGYAVLRGAVTDDYKYFRPQEHFKNILLTMCSSSNFDQIRQRTGQSIELGFGLSSDIWITHLMNEIGNKKIQAYFQTLRNPMFLEKHHRERAYNSFQNQLRELIYVTSEFPDEGAELKVIYPQLKKLLLDRIGKEGLDNTSIVKQMEGRLTRPDYRQQEEYLSMIALYANFYDPGTSALAEALNAVRREQADFPKRYFDYLDAIYTHELPVTPESDERIYELIDTSHVDDMSSYYALMHTIHTKGYVHEETIEQVREFYYQHDGMSSINECLRLAILSYFSRVLENLTVDDYHEYFELNRVFNLYMGIFNNEEFNQSVKRISLRYIQRLIKRYTDKRGKDYQEIKKWVIATFVEQGFMTEKKVAEVFKTRRKKRVVKD